VEKMEDSMSKPKTAEARILAGAKEMIRSGRHQFVCHAVQDAARVYGERHALNRVTERIKFLLDGQLVLNQWIAHHVGESDYVRQDEKMRQTRLLWIDDMIDWWESQA
jgi:hypothetical protein